jgi:hypothetical protein
MPPKVEVIDKGQIQINLKPEFVQFSLSSQSGNTYSVDYEHNIPCCSCPDFVKHHWPCKHILAVFEHFPDYGWDALNSIYTSQPCFNIDADIEKTVSSDAFHVGEKLQDGDMCTQENSPVIDTNTCAKMDEPDDPISKKTTDAVSVRKTCVELLKNIQNNLYASDNVAVLLEVERKLFETDTFLDDNCPKICGIPTRRKTKTFQLKPKVVRSSHQCTASQSTNLVEENVPMDSDIRLTEHSEMEESISPEHMPFIEGLH